MPSLLFVCTGNMYRSPFAAAVFRQCLERDGTLKDWRVDSAGTWTRPGQPVPAAAVRMAKKAGVDIEGHLTRMITPGDFQLHNVLLVMEDGHREALLHEFPSGRKKIHLLTEAAGRTAHDIPDPAKTGDLEPVFHEIYDLIVTGYRSFYSLIYLEDGGTKGWEGTL